MFNLKFHSESFTPVKYPIKSTVNTNAYISDGYYEHRFSLT